MPGEGAGIFTTNMPARGWLAYEELAKKRADLIALNIIGARDGSAHVDYTVNVITGFPMVTGPVGHEGPVNAARPPSISPPPMPARSSLAAERHRRMTGQGQKIVLPLQDMAPATTSALGYIGEAVVNDVDRPRFGNEIFGTFGRDFRTKDGRFVMICIFSIAMSTHWRRPVDSRTPSGRSRSRPASISRAMPAAGMRASSSLP